MTKDVVISVRGLQVMDNESAEDIETVQQGEYFERNGSIFYCMTNIMRALTSRSKCHENQGKRNDPDQTRHHQRPDEL